MLIKMRLVQFKNENHNIIAGIGCHEELVYEDKFECRKSYCLNNREEGFSFKITFLVLDEKGIPVLNEDKYKNIEMTILHQMSFL